MPIYHKSRPDTRLYFVKVKTKTPFFLCQNPSPSPLRKRVDVLQYFYLFTGFGTLPLSPNAGEIFSTGRKLFYES